MLLLYDSQYPQEYDYIAQSAADARVLTLDTAAGGQDDKDAWLDAMRQNAQALRDAAA